MNADGDALELPLLPLKNVVLFPQMIVPLFVGRERSILALEEAVGASRRIFLAMPATREEQPAAATAAPRLRGGDAQPTL